MNSQKLKTRRGVVLVIVLVVISVLALSAFTFTELMLTHRHSAKLTGRQLQATALVESGVDSLRNYLMQTEAVRAEAGGHFDNPMIFQAQPILLGSRPSDRGNFTILAPNYDEFGNLASVRFGLQDESTRLNLNALPIIDAALPDGARSLLLALPGMTEDVADAILDWIDDNDEPRDFGLESDHYQQKTPPYSCKDGPLDSIEELLLVEGVTPDLLFGMDTNRNGVVDQHEMTQWEEMGMAAPLQTDPITGASMELGWSGYLTLLSKERNLTRDGMPRINLNKDDLELLYTELSEVFSTDIATFVVAYRQNGAYDGDEEGESGVSGELDFSRPGETQLSQVLDLVGKKVQVQFDGDDEPTVLAPVFPEDFGAMALYMSTLMDMCSTSDALFIPGRININQAPKVILMGIPGFDEEIVDAIIQERVMNPEDEMTAQATASETWLLTSAIVTMEQMRLLVPFINGGGDVYRAQIVGYFEDGGAAARAEVIIDSTEPVPRILSWRDISHLGRGYPMDVLGVQFLDFQATP